MSEVKIINIKCLNCKEKIEENIFFLQVSVIQGKKIKQLNDFCSIECCQNWYKKHKKICW